MKHDRVLSWLALFISLVLLLLPRIVPICTGLANGTQPMLCHYTYQAEFLITILAVIFSGSLLVLSGTEAKLVNSLVIFLLGMVILILPQPWALGICPESGACHKTTFFVTSGGALFTLAGAVLLWINYRKFQEEE